MMQKASLTSLERVALALQSKEIDRTPAGSFAGCRNDYRGFGGLCYSPN